MVRVAYSAVWAGAPRFSVGVTGMLAEFTLTGVTGR